MEKQAADNNLAMAQALANFQAQLQTLGSRMDQLEQPQAPPQRRTAMRKITPPQDAMEEDDFRETPYSDNVDPKPPDPLTRIPRRLGQHMKHKQGYDDPLRPNTSDFVGNSNPETYIAWEFHMEELFDCYNYNDSEKIDMAVARLMGNALSWWTREASERRRHHYTQISSWEDLKQHLRKRYVPYSFRKNFPNCFNRLIPSNKAMKQRGFQPQDMGIYVQEKQEQTCVKKDLGTKGRNNKPTHFSNQKVIIQKAIVDKNISNQSTWHESQTKPEKEDVQVMDTTKVTSYLSNTFISYPMTSLMYLSLSKEAETG